MCGFVVRIRAGPRSSSDGGWGGWGALARARRAARLERRCSGLQSIAAILRGRAGGGLVWAADQVVRERERELTKPPGVVGRLDGDGPCSDIGR